MNLSKVFSGSDHGIPILLETSICRIDVIDCHSMISCPCTELLPKYKVTAKALGNGHRIEQLPKYRETAKV